MVKPAVETVSPPSPPVVRSLPRRLGERQRFRASGYYEPQETNRNMIVLQVKTVPSGADVVVDNEFIGKSPIRVLVDRNRNHRLQISKEGYSGVIKRIDRSQFGSEKVIHLLQKLSPVY